jgi:DNA-binding response OmpR family regulator
MLEAEGHTIESEGDVSRASRSIASSDCEIAVIDLDRGEGFGWLHLARVAQPFGGTLAILSSSLTADRVAALDAGADDCLPKPFSMPELCARVRALGRRLRQPAGAVLRLADLQLDRMERRVERCGRAIELTPKEFALLEFLMCHPGAPLPRAAILQHVWNFGLEANHNLVDVYINYLRKKIDGPFTPKLIQTVRGIGYQVTGA